MPHADSCTEYCAKKHCEYTGCTKDNQHGEKYCLQHMEMMRNTVNRIALETRENARDIAREHSCPRCDAKPGDPCTIPDLGISMRGHLHIARYRAANLI